MDLNALSRSILGDRPPLFEADFAACIERMREELAGRTVLVIGAGGTIGRATAQVLMEQRPARTLLVDVSENNLVEVTRTIRNAMPRDAPVFEAWPLDYSGAAFRALLEREQPDIVLNFAAFKHVRSEKDQLTIAEMLRVNVLGNLALLRWGMESGKAKRIFVISTDKAVNPVSFMGASKRLMESLIFAAARAEKPAADFVTTTRFANVMFSDGSLPHSFLTRIDAGQPLAGPNDIERYFISPREAGMLCLMAAFHPGNDELLIPNMREADLMQFDVLAERLLKLRGYSMKNYADEVEAAFANASADIEAGEWPCLFTPASTSGEKAYEEFVEDGEKKAAQQPYGDCTVLAGDKHWQWAEISARLDALSEKLSSAKWLIGHDKAQMGRIFEELVPSFSHIETGQSLDQRV